MIATHRNMIEMRKRFPDGEPIVMYCMFCDGEWSGNDGDYVNYPLDYELQCPECSQEFEDEVLLLGVKRITVDYLTRKS